MSNGNKEFTLELRSVSLEYDGIPLFRGLDLSVGPGDAVGIVGAEGTGKSTLLRISAGLCAPGAGSVHLLGAPLADMNERERRRARAALGFIQQRQGLLVNMTLGDNFLLPSRYHNRSGEEHEARVRDLIRELDLGPHLERFPADLPEGVRRRAGLARALAGAPSLLLADHLLEGGTPDALAKTGEQVRKARQAWRTSVVLTGQSPHEMNKLADRVLLLEDGRLRPL